MPRELGLFPPPYLAYLLHGFVSKPKPLAEPPFFKFYLSFEDALWDIVRKNQLAGGSFLFPDFFCMDVVHGLEKRGLTGYSYKLNGDFSVNNDSFLSLLKERKPELIFIYNVLGSRSELLKDTSWITEIDSCRTIIIEDGVDCLIQGQYHPIVENHFVIDSLRKVSPFQGARLFFHQPLEGVSEPHISENRNTIEALHLWVRALNFITYFFPVRRLLEVKWEQFGAQSDLVGVSEEPLMGSSAQHFLFRSLHQQKIRQKVELLFKRYSESFGERMANLSPFLSSLCESNEVGGYRFFPLVLPKGVGEKLSSKLERYGIYVDTHFDDSPFCSTRDCVLLPLWPTYKESDIDYIAAFVVECLQSTNEDDEKNCCIRP